MTNWRWFGTLAGAETNSNQSWIDIEEKFFENAPHIFKQY
jgi:hypothetical protein